MENSTKAFNASCLLNLLQTSNPNSNSTSSFQSLTQSEVDSCSSGHARHEIEEGVSYVAGNTLWAFYQFTVVIVLLSILRARMVNTYHRVFKEADVQWKYFR